MLSHFAGNFGKSIPGDSLAHGKTLGSESRVSACSAASSGHRCRPARRRWELRHACRRMRPFSTLCSVRSEPEASIKGAIPTARWTVQVLAKQKAPICGTFAEPSSGLEPETPSLPWKFESVTRVHARSFATQFLLQIGLMQAENMRREASRVSFLMCPFCVRPVLPDEATQFKQRARRRRSGSPRCGSRFSPGPRAWRAPSFGRGACVDELWLRTGQAGETD